MLKLWRDKTATKLPQGRFLRLKQAVLSAKIQLYFVGSVINKQVVKRRGCFFAGGKCNRKGL